ncbi:hypothetical protein R3P38DRAFT_2797247 [Favolaschia claudopus]|uniref:DUF6534 domain-containing protein n=1 Tax=Favolaschia claudopus TaxID=2862362 RepID=A0AAW0A359_9AGAR
MPGHSTTPRLPRTTLIPLDDTIGALVIGAILSSSYCSRDSLLLKSFVAVLLSLDTLHGALVAYALYVTVVTNFGDYASLTKLPWSGVIETIIGALVAGMVQFFYAWRIYALSKKSFILPFIIAICAVLGFVFGTLYAQKGLSVPYVKVEGLLLVYSSTALAFSITSDIIITVAMLYYLSRSKTGMKATNRAINTLVAYAISSGLVTTMFAIADLIAVSLVKSFCLLFIYHIRESDMDGSESPDPDSGSIRGDGFRYGAQYIQLEIIYEECDFQRAPARPSVNSIAKSFQNFSVATREQKPSTK